MYYLVAVAALPLVTWLLAFDLRWIARSLARRRLPPWGAPVRVIAALCCHGGIALLLWEGGAGGWPPERLRYWLHMTLDPGLTFYALGLWELAGRLQPRQKPHPQPAGGSSIPHRAEGPSIPQRAEGSSIQ